MRTNPRCFLFGSSGYLAAALLALTWNIQAAKIYVPAQYSSIIANRFPGVLNPINPDSSAVGTKSHVTRIVAP
jgi:hypothetical protein